MLPKLENLYFFFLSFSKDIKGKQLTVNFNNLNYTILQSKIHTKNSQKGLNNARKIIAIHTKNSQKGLNNAWKIMCREPKWKSSTLVLTHVEETE